MTESPFVKAEGPEPPNVADILREKHRETMARLDDSILDQLAKQSIVHIPENTAQIFVEDRGNMYTVASNNPSTATVYYREPMQPDRAEIERVRDEVYRTQMELSRQRNKLAQAIDEFNRVSNSLSRAETKLFDAYQLIAQLSGFLDSIEWGTHDEWTRSQSLRGRTRQVVESFTVSNTIAT